MNHYLIYFCNPYNIAGFAWYQYIFLALAVVCYSISQLHQFGKLKWSDSEDGFFGSDSWVNKYEFKWSPDDSGFTKAPDNWYYRFFNLTYKERFPLSATALVLFTDGYHLFQFIMKVCFSIGIAGFTWWAVLAFTLWTGIQYGCFKLFSK